MTREREQRTDAVVYHPSQEFVESTNVYDFMQTYDIDDYEDLIERTTSEVEEIGRAHV